MNVQGKPWAAGQLAPYLRTPTLYYLTSLLTQEGMKAVVCGTTNRDEGAYLGFFGKASDGMVDLQLIADLHKSEVYALGKLLAVPEKILTRTPTRPLRSPITTTRLKLKRRPPAITRATRRASIVT
jgi:NAD+ synthase (glutamine-hydrolysing)